MPADAGTHAEPLYVYVKVVRGLLLLFVVVRHRVPDEAMCCAVFLLLDSNTIYVNVPPSRCCRMYSLDLPVILYSHTICHHASPQLRACAEPRRTLARRSEAPLVNTFKMILVLARDACYDRGAPLFF